MKEGLLGMRISTGVCVGICITGAASIAPANPAIFFTDTSADSINRVALDGSDATTLVTGFGTNLNGITVAQNQIFWSDISADAIFSSALDGSGADTFLDLSVLDGIIFASDLTNDGQNIYFSDGPFEERLFRSPIGSPSLNQIGSDIDIDGLEADPNAGRLYSFDFNEIFRSNLDGSGFGPILAGRSGIDALTVDPTSNTLLWAEDGVFFTAAGDGSGVSELLDLSTVPDFGASFVSDVAYFDGMLYWSESGDSDGSWSLDLSDVDAGPTQVLAQTGIGNLVVIPAPGAVSLLVLAGGAAARRQR